MRISDDELLSIIEDGTTKKELRSATRRVRLRRAIDETWLSKPNDVFSYTSKVCLAPSGM